MKKQITAFRKASPRDKRIAVALDALHLLDMGDIRIAHGVYWRQGAGACTCCAIGGAFAGYCYI